jgi:hypothetical protein
MSTQLAKFYGITDKEKISVGSNITLHSFYGEKIRGKSLLIQASESYIELDNESVIKLIEVLQSNFLDNPVNINNQEKELHHYSISIPRFITIQDKIIELTNKGYKIYNILPLHYSANNSMILTDALIITNKL